MANRLLGNAVGGWQEYVEVRRCNRDKVERSVRWLLDRHVTRALNSWSEMAARDVLHRGIVEASGERMRNRRLVCVVRSW